MEKTNEHINQTTHKVLHTLDLSTLEKYIYEELKGIGCENINIWITQYNEMIFATEKVPIIRLCFNKDRNRYGVLINEIADNSESNRLEMKVDLMRIFDESETLPLSSMSVYDTLTVIEQTEEGTKLRLMHRASDLITYKTQCDADTARELVKQIFEISKL